MKILLVSEYWKPIIHGGGELSANSLAERLVSKGYKVTVITSGRKDLPKLEETNGMKIIRVGNAGEPRGIIGALKRRATQKKIKKKVKEIVNNFDIVHFLNTSIMFDVPRKSFATINSYVPLCPKGNLYYNEEKQCSGHSFRKCVKCMKKSNYIGKIKNPWYIRHNILARTFIYQLMKQRLKQIKKIDKIIAVSEFVKECLETAGVKTNKIDVIPNIVNIPKKNKTIPYKKTKKITISYIGVLELIKGIDILVESAKQLPEIDFLIAGFGGEEKELRKTAPSNVKFLGRIQQNQINDFYNKSDVIALPVKWPEPLSRTMIEAISMGKALIATPYGGNTDLLKEGKNGLLIDPTPENFIQAIKKLNPSKIQEMGKNSKQIYMNLESKTPY